MDDVQRQGQLDCSSELPRERLRALGPEALTVAELIAVVLGTGLAGEGVQRTAERVLLESGGVERLSRRRVAELARIRGLGPARAARLAACFALGRRALAAAVEPRPQLGGPEDVDRMMRPLLVGLGHETFWVLALSVKNQVVDRLEIGRGSLTGVDVHPREVFRFLIGVGAAAGVVVHNHPSGDPEPSDADVELTYRLASAGRLLGLPIVDHVIVAADGFRSLMESGTL